MVYFRKSKKKRFYRKRPKVSKNTYRAINRVVAKRFNKNLETKFIDSNVVCTTFGTHVQCVTSLVQGQQDIGQRVGDQVKSKNFYFKGQITNADTYNVIRISVVRINQMTNPSSPFAVGDIYQNVSTTSLLLNSAFNMDNIRAGMFTIMYDRKFKVDSDDPVVLINCFKRLKHRIDFQANTNIAKGHIFFYITNDSQASPNPTVDIYTRYTYTDA